MKWMNLSGAMTALNAITHQTEFQQNEHMFATNTDSMLNRIFIAQTGNRAGKGDGRMINKEWLATLPKETWWDVVHEWLFHEYGMQWTDTRLAVMKWLEEEHKPVTSYRTGVTWE